MAFWHKSSLHNIGRIIRYMIARRAFAPFMVVLFRLCVTLMLSTQAHAQSASFRSVDTNRDGILSYDEIVAEFGRAGAGRLLRQSDRNSDRFLTIQELRQTGDRTNRTENRGSSDDDDDDNDRDGRGDDDGDDGDDGGDDGDGDGDGGDGEGDD